MTTRDNARREAARSQQLLARGAVAGLGGFPLLCLVGTLTLTGSLPAFFVHPLQLVVGCGFGTMVYAHMRLRKRVRCLACGVSLGYLLLQYPGLRRSPFDLPGDLPPGVAACPYCGADVDAPDAAAS